VLRTIVVLLRPANHLIWLMWLRPNWHRLATDTW